MAVPRDFDSFQIGETGSLQRVVTAEDVARFVDLTGDDNPVHVDEEYAAGIAGGRVVHGMLTAGYVSTVIGTILPGPGALWMSERFSFRAPVRIGDRIDVEVQIRHKSPGTRVLILDVSVRNQHGKVVLDGEAHVQVLEKVAEMAERTGSIETVVVTGSGRGIGAAMASRLAADGLRVVVNYRSGEGPAEATVRAIRDAGGDAIAFAADVSDPEQVEALLARARDTYGPVDALINNAGSGTNPLPLKDLRWADMEEHLATHLRGSFLCAQAVLPSMVERGCGRIVNITSQSAYGTPPPKMTGYVVAKAALAALTRSLALEVGPHGVTVNAVAPGMTDTDMVADVPQRAKLTLAAQAPVRRLTEPDDVAAVASFLLSPGASMITGQTIHVSGGQVMT